MLPDIIQDIERDLTIERVLSHYKAGKADRQDGGQVVRYFCPFKRCRGDRRPHFVVDGSKAVDGFGKRIDFSRHVNQDVVVRRFWKCEQSRISGYGTISLVAAVNGFPVEHERLSRKQWVKIINECCDILGRPRKELDSDALNGWLLENAGQPRWRISIADGFTPEALTALSLDGFDDLGADFIVRHLHQDLGIWQVEKYVMAQTVSGGKSYERRAHALFPIFAFCYDFESGELLTSNPEKRTDKWVARIVMPAFQRIKGEDFDWKSDFWTVFGSDNVDEDLRDFKMRVSVFGDVTAMAVTRSRDAETEAKKIGEEVATTREEEETSTNEKGKEVKEIVEVELDADEVRLNKCVLCCKPLDGVSSYMWLNYPRWRFTDQKTGECKSQMHRNNYWHVAWLRGSDMVLNIWENAQLSIIATDTFELFGNDRSEISAANNNAMRFPYLRLCFLPTSMSQMDQVDSGFGKPHVPHTPRDFFRYYEPTMNEATRNMLVVGSTAGVKSLMLQKELNGSSAFKPFTQVPKKKPVPGQKKYTYELNLAACWQMMQNQGYCRALRPQKKRDTIGQSYRIDGHFIYELDPASVMADMRKALEDYAKDFATDVEDAEMMLNAMLKCKDLQNERNITKLPLVSMPKSESYGPELDYFFFRNGALEITPKSISFHKYEDLDFLVYRSQVLPFDYHTPFFGNSSPISIVQSKEYTDMEDELLKLQKRDDVPSDIIFDKKRRLKDFSVVGRWNINITPTESLDPRIVVPRTIKEDNEHNQWLRWWPFLRLLRCFANEDFAEEEAGRFTDVDRRALQARMANLMFTLGRCIFRYRGGGVQYMPYFLENTVDREGKAQGGSGKSTLIETFVAFVRNVCNVNGKDISANGDFARNFSNFVRHQHDVVHIEDFPKMAIDPLFNYASGSFRSRSLFENPEEIEHEEAPNIVITSNFMVQSTDESALGRVQFGGMSHYFSREVAVMNKEGRRLDTIMPDMVLSGKPEVWDDEQRGQIIYTLAKCLQFCMVCTNLHVQVAVPGSELLVRLSRTELGDSFYDWFTNFLEKPHIYNAPIAINEIFNDYRRYLDPSKARVDNVSRTKFYENMQKYCAKPAHGVLFMPIKPLLSASEINRSRKKAEDGTEKSYLRKGSSWLTRTFVDAEGRVHRARVLSKNAGDGSVTGGAVWFSKVGTEPKDAEELQRILDAFMTSPDPEPICDENDNPITSEQYKEWTMLNTDEEAETIRKAGGVRRGTVIPSAVAAPVDPLAYEPVKTGEATPEGLPF